VLAIFGVIPVIGLVVGLAGSIWQLATMVVAVRQALDYDSTGRAIAVCLVGFVIYLAFIIVVGSIIGGGVAAVS
jgi:hypothetical protein